MPEVVAITWESPELAVEYPPHLRELVGHAGIILPVNNNDSPVPPGSNLETVTVLVDKLHDFGSRRQRC